MTNIFKYLMEVRYWIIYNIYMLYLTLYVLLVSVKDINKFCHFEWGFNNQNINLSIIRIIYLSNSS